MMGFGCDFAEDREEERKQAFCMGFAYGTKYGYKGVIAHEGLSEREMRGGSLISSTLFDELQAKERGEEDKDGD